MAPLAIQGLTAHSGNVAAKKTGGKMGRPLAIPGPLGELAEVLGGRRQLAEACGVGERYIAKWVNERVVPSQPVRLVLSALAVQHGIKPPYPTTKDCEPPAWLDEDDDE